VLKPEMKAMIITWMEKILQV